jgi:hypothetical protein
LLSRDWLAAPEPGRWHRGWRWLVAGDSLAAGPNAVFTGRYPLATDRATLAREHGGDGGAKAMLYDRLEPAFLLDLGRSSIIDVVLILAFTATAILGTLRSTPLG